MKYYLYAGEADYSKENGRRAMTFIAGYWTLLGTNGLTEVLPVDNLSTGPYLTALKPQKSRRTYGTRPILRTFLRLLRRKNQGQDFRLTRTNWWQQARLEIGFTIRFASLHSETIELMETTEAPLALDTAGETWGSLVFQDTMRGVVGECGWAPASCVRRTVRSELFFFESSLYTA